MIYNSAYNWGHLSLLDQTCFYCIAQIDAEWNSLTRGSTCLAIPALIFLGLANDSFSGAAIVATPLLPLYLPPVEEAARDGIRVALPESYLFKQRPLREKMKRNRPDNSRARLIKINSKPLWGV